MKPEFDGNAFYATLDAARHARGMNWKEVAAAAGVSPSTMTRLSQGKRPDLDSLAALLVWSGLSADDFIRGPADGSRSEADPLTKIASFVTGDPGLSQEGRAAFVAIVSAAYNSLRSKP
jgi:transcriptional regulator with XRE-family HTH domain